LLGKLPQRAGQKMTAEIAILNKSAIALATDSVVTISSGDHHDKTYDTADKLFELSCSEPIGIMVYNGMTFMDMPLPPLIKEFRENTDSFSCVEDAAKAFLKFLNEEGQKANDEVMRRATLSIVAPYIKQIEEHYKKKIIQTIRPVNQKDGNGGRTIDLDDINKQAAHLLCDILDAQLNAFKKQKKGTFIGGNALPRFSAKTRRWIEDYIETEFIPIMPIEKAKLVELGKYLLLTGVFSRSLTGLIFCGFGSSDRFPTLISFEIDGIICGRLKYQQTNHCDIDRNGPQAAVLPYAQKEMVDRFVFGIDEKIKNDVQRYCRDTVKETLDAVVKAAGAEGNNEVTKKADAAEKKFSKNLNEKIFESIRHRSRREIEDMVEFMPKPEMARMAEALVELTSIKRRVSRGFETVGGPIDVAVISKAEGFTWVKRKHYFPPEINARYFERIRSKMYGGKGDEQ
jgi:3-methyladenine DNA glycosylase AlkC